jgi:hypothetical protein
VLNKFMSMTCKLDSTPQPTPDKPIPARCVPIFSMDNASVHVRLRDVFALGQLKMPKSSFDCSPPPYSGDLHKVIEHVHGTLCSAFERWLERQTKMPDTLEELYAKLEAMFYDIITPESVQKDVASLQDTFKEVIRLGGQNPARKFR